MKKMILMAGIVFAGLATASAQEVKTEKGTVTAQAPHRTKAVRAQQNASPEEMARHKVERLEKQAGSLTDDQKEKAHSIFLEEAKANESRAELRKESNDKIEALLTDEQRANIKAAKERKREEMKSKRVERGPTRQAPGNKE